MKTLILLFLTFALRVHAHIGSPNVFFDGTAGDTPVRVVIRPPSALPGIAQVDIRTPHTGPINVQPVFLSAPEHTAPPPLAATRVADGLFNAAPWLNRPGDYAIRITLGDGGNFTVPLRAVAFARPEMPRGSGFALAATGIVLFLAAVAIARAAARESILDPNAAPAPADNRRGTLAGGVAFIALAAAVYATSVRWQRMDAAFLANALVKIQPVTASVRSEEIRHFLTIALPADATGDWSTLVTDHGKLMHLFLVASGDGRSFAHLHPARLNSRTFETVLPPLPPGEYTLYGETTREDGGADTVTGSVKIPPPLGAAPQVEWTMAGEAWCQSPPALQPDAAGTPGRLDADDSWHTGPAATTRAAPLMNGAKMILHTPGEFAAARDTLLRFSVADAAGRAVPLQTYMGMRGHCVIRRDDGSVFTHLHPNGSVSMAAQQIIGGNSTPTAEPANETSEVTFPYAFPKPGRYRVWTQVRTGSRVLTGVFDVDVK